MVSISTDAVFVSVGVLRDESSAVARDAHGDSLILLLSHSLLTFSNHKTEPQIQIDSET